MKEVSNLKDDKIKYGLGGLFIGGLLMWLTTMTIVNSGNANMMGMMGYGSGNKLSIMQDKSIIDAHFIEQMIPHHQMALMMVQMLEVGTNRPEMIELAKNITVSQSKEIKDMQGWYANWYK